MNTSVIQGFQLSRQQQHLWALQCEGISYEAQCAIAGGMIAKECAALSARGFAITPAEQVSDVVIQRGYHERLGARPMRDATELLIRNALAQELLSGGDGAGRLVPHSDGQQLQLAPATS